MPTRSTASARSARCTTDLAPSNLTDVFTPKAVALIAGLSAEQQHLVIRLRCAHVPSRRDHSYFTPAQTAAHTDFERRWTLPDFGCVEHWNRWYAWERGLPKGTRAPYGWRPRKATRAAMGAEVRAL